MVRGTTPTIKFKFSVVDPNDIVVAFLSVKQKNNVLEKDISDAVIGEDYISWDLTQAETLSFAKGAVNIECRYRTTSGKAYKTKVLEEGVEDVQKDGEI